MDPEEKELLKRLLSKVENLEKEMKEIKTGSGSAASDVSKVLNLPPMPKTNDKLARVIIQKAREKIIREAIDGKETTPGVGGRTMEEKVQEIRENFDLGEVALFALKKKLIKVGKPAEEESESGTVVIKEE